MCHVCPAVSIQLFPTEVWLPAAPRYVFERANVSSVICCQEAAFAETADVKHNNAANAGSRLLHRRSKDHSDCWECALAVNTIVWTKLYPTNYKCAAFACHKNILSAICMPRRLIIGCTAEHSFQLIRLRYADRRPSLPTHQCGGEGSLHYWSRSLYSQNRLTPGIQSVPARGSLAIAAASTVRATRSSRSRLWTLDLPQARASVVNSIVSTFR